MNPIQAMQTAFTELLKTKTGEKIPPSALQSLRQDLQHSQPLSRGKDIPIPIENSNNKNGENDLKNLSASVQQKEEPIYDIASSDEEEPIYDIPSNDKEQLIPADTLPSKKTNETGMKDKISKPLKALKKDTTAILKNTSKPIIGLTMLRVLLALVTFIVAVVSFFLALENSSSPQMLSILKTVATVSSATFVLIGLVAVFVKKSEEHKKQGLTHQNV